MMVTQKKHKFYEKQRHDPLPHNAASNFVGTIPREIEDLLTLFSCVVLKNTAIEAETKRNRMANETSAIETPPAPKEAAGVPPYLPTNPNPTQSIE